MGEDRIGSLSVDIEAPIKGVKSSVDAAEQILESLAAKTYTIKIDDSRLSTLLDLVTKTKAELAGTGKQIQSRNVEIKVKTIIDGKDLISQIQGALNDHVFKIKVEGQVTGLTSSTEHTVRVQGVAAAGSGAGGSAPSASADLERMFNNKKAKTLRESVSQMYAALDAVGKELSGAKRPAEQMAEMASKFGTSFQDFSKFIGSIPEFKTDQSLKGVFKAFTAAVGPTGVFQTLRGDIGSGGQATQQAARQTAAIVRQPTVRQAVNAQPVAGPMLAEARKRSDEEIRRAIGSAPVVGSLIAGLSPFTRTTRRRGPAFDRTGTGNDPAADIIANRQLGDVNTANVRRLRRTTPPTPFAGGIGGNVDLEPLLRLAERGGFQNLVEESSGKNKGQLRRLTATGGTTGELLESEAALHALSRRRKGFSLPNVPGLGQVAPVQPSEAFARAVAEMTGAERQHVDELMANPEVANRVSQAIRQGGRARPLDSSRGAGNFALGPTPQAHARQDYEAGIRFITPDEARIAAQESTLEGAANRKRISEGMGLSPREVNERLMNMPEILGMRQKELVGSGQLPDPSKVVDEFGSRLNAPGALAGGSRGSAMHRIFEELSEELSGGFGDDQEIKQLGKTMLGDIRSALFGENRTRTDFAEEDIKSRERPIRGGLRNPRSNAPSSAGSYSGFTDRFTTNKERAALAHEASIRQGLRPTTDLDVARQGLEGQLLKARGDLPEKIAGLEGDRGTNILDPERLAKTLEKLNAAKAQLKAAESPIRAQLAQISKTQGAAQTAALGLGEQFPDNHTAQMGAIAGLKAPRGINQAAFGTELAQLLEFREAKRGLTTGGMGAALGRPPGKQMTGDQMRKTYSRMGITIGDENVPPFAGFNAGGGSGAGAGGGPGGGGSGPWHVIIDGPFPLQVTGTGGGGGGGRRGAGTGAPPPPDDESTAGGAAAETRNGSGSIRYLRSRYGSPAEGAVPLGRAARIVISSEQRAEIERRERESGINLRARPRVVISPEQRAAERAAAAAAGRQASFGTIFSTDDVVRREAIRRRALTTPLDAQAFRTRGEIAAARGSLASRSIPTTFVSLAESLFGGRQRSLGRFAELQATAARAERIGTDITGLTGRRAQAGENVRELVGQARAIRANGQAIPADLSSAIRKNFTEFQGLNKVLGQATKEYKASNAEVVKLQKAAVGASDILQNLGAGFVGGIAGGLAGGVISAASGAIVTGIQESLGPILERASGFQNVAGQKTGGIADLIRQSGGNVQGAVAGTLAGTGLSSAAAAQISPAISQRSAVEAGNKALAEQIDLLHTAESISKQNAGAAGGLDKGIIATTGGLFGTSLGGTASTQELLKNELVGTLQPGSTVESVSAGRGGGVRSVQVTPQQVAASLKLATDRLTYFNDAAEKGGSSIRLLSVAAGQASEAQVKQSAQLAHNAGLYDLENKLLETHTALGGASSAADVQQFLQAINQGAQTPTPALVLQGQERSIRAQVQQENAQLQQRLQVQIPAEAGIAQLERPIGDLSKALAPLLRAAGRPADKSLQGLQSQITQQTGEGANIAVADVAQTLGPIKAMDFMGALGKAAAYGKQISDLQIGVETEQAALAAHQYSAQLIVANRSLSDAKGLVGDITDSTKNLGSIQREQFMLQRQGESLSLGMTQRQINFQKAIAAFQAPGETSAERSARIKEAQLEADYAQKQLDIRKKLFGLGGTQFNIEAGRSLQDATRNVALLKEGFTVSVDTAVAGKKIQALTVLQDKQNKKVDAYYNAAVNRTNDIIALEGQLVAATGKDLAKVAQDVINAYVGVYKGITDAINNNNPGGGGSGNGLGDKKDWVKYPHDGLTWGQGGIVKTQGVMNLGELGIAGEAAGEAVAIIKNPHALNGGGAGGNVFVSIIFQGPVSVRSDDDIKSLASQVQLEMNRKLANIGARIAG